MWPAELQGSLGGPDPGEQVGGGDPVTKAWGQLLPSPTSHSRCIRAQLRVGIDEPLLTSGLKHTVCGQGLAQLSGASAQGLTVYQGPAGWGSLLRLHQGRACFKLIGLLAGFSSPWPKATLSTLPVGPRSMVTWLIKASRRELLTRPA